MNKKVMILMASMLFFTTSVVPTTNQQEEASLLEYIHAADKVGELAQFADDMYIELLEKNNEELGRKSVIMTVCLKKQVVEIVAFSCL